MDQSFVTIHDLSPEAHIVFSSASITDILGYNAGDVVNMGIFPFIHPNEVPYARLVHQRCVSLDKAASHHFLNLLHRDGQWVQCEVTFTILHDMIIARVGLYRRSRSCSRRSSDASNIRKLFSCSAKDPRYRMLSQLSPKFQAPSLDREYRAALILNRFTRKLTVLYASSGISEIFDGLRPQDVHNQSFYDCIHEFSLASAMAHLEGVKASDSMVHFRFWYRSPFASSWVDGGGYAGDGQIPVTESSYEVEAIVSCTADGLILVLRKARTPIPTGRHSVRESDASVARRQQGHLQREVVHGIVPGMTAHNSPPSTRLLTEGASMDQMIVSMRDALRSPYCRDDTLHNTLVNSTMMSATLRRPKERANYS